MFLAIRTCDGEHPLQNLAKRLESRNMLHCACETVRREVLVIHLGSKSFAAVLTDFGRAVVISTISDDELSSATVGGVLAAPLSNAAMIGNEESIVTFSWTLARVSLEMLVLERKPSLIRLGQI
jgi:hypothetical protein